MNLAQDWITYIFIAFFIGFWTYIIIKGRKTSEDELQNGGIGKEEKASKKD
jgi:cbb3-type cytochrome oxidase subunit 3